jgi:hypothetical protein
MRVRWAKVAPALKASGHAKGTGACTNNGAA